MDENRYDISYIIDEGMVLLNGKKKNIFCRCGYVIGSWNDKGSIMSRGALITVYDKRTNSFILKCSKCKSIEIISVDNPSAKTEVAI